MPRTIKLSIAGRAAETDAPTVQDLLGQLRDYFEILRGVEEAIAEDGSSAVEWRIVNASMNSPLQFEAAPFPRVYGTYIDDRVETVVQHAAKGLHALETGAGRPRYFSEKTLAIAERVYERVANGLSATSIHYGPKLPPSNLDWSIARAAIPNIKAMLQLPDKPYRELGSVECFVHGLDVDGHGHRVLRARHRLTGDEITCHATGEALAAFAERRVGEVWDGQRVELFGTLYYRKVGRIHRVDAERVRFFRARSELPRVDDILDQNFTGGLRTEDYLARIRSGNLTT